MKYQSANILFEHWERFTYWKKLTNNYNPQLYWINVIKRCSIKIYKATLFEIYLSQSVFLEKMHYWANGALNPPPPLIQISYLTTTSMKKIHWESLNITFNIFYYQRLISCNIVLGWLIRNLSNVNQDHNANSTINRPLNGATNFRSNDSIKLCL